jgi:putative hydrolase of the HAD superfamily
VVVGTLFFDGDQTLWDFDKVMRCALHSTLLELQARRPGTEHVTVDDLIADRQALAIAGRTHEQLRLLAFQRTLTRLGLPDNGLAEHLTTLYLERRFAEVALYPDTLDALNELRRTYTLGLLSNGNTYPERSGLAGLFTLTVFSQDHGVTKPHPELFSIAAAQAGCPPESIAMIGDSLTKDVTAAQACGWRGIWLNRTAAPCPPPHTPDATIASLAELPARLKAL